MTHEQLNLYLTTALAAVAVLIAGYGAYRLQAREDGQTTLQRLRKLETAQASADVRQANFEIRQQGFQAEIEGVADHGKREREAMAENFRQQLATMEANFKRDMDGVKELLKQLPIMGNLLTRVDERFLGTTKEFDKLDRKMDQILSVLSHK